MVKNVLTKAINVLSILIIGGAVLILLNVVMTKPGEAPSVMGYSLFRVMTGSMEPTIPIDSVIITHAVEPEEIEVGDVISYFSKDPALNGSVNTHRVMDITEENGTVFYQTRGDANNANDLYPPTAHEIIGKVVFSSYFLGKVVRLISNPLIFFGLILIPMLVLVILNLVRAFRTAAKMARQEEEQEILEAIQAARERRAAEEAAGEGSDEP